VFTLIVYMLKSVCNRITCVCHLITKDYLLSLLILSYLQLHTGLHVSPKQYILVLVEYRQRSATGQV